MLSAMGSYHPTMQREDPNERVRPLPPPLPEDVPVPARRSRWWAPLGLTAALVVAFSLLVAVFNGSGEPASDATDTTTPFGATTTTAPTTSSTTTTAPPALAIPDLTRGARVVLFNGANGVLEQWSPGARAARTTRINERPDVVEFDPSSELIALVEFEPAVAGSLHTGSTPASLQTQFVNVTSAAWHATTPRAIAFLATLPFEDEISLLTAVIDPPEFELAELRRVATVSERMTLVAWGDWGFAFADSEDGALDVDGRPFVPIPTFTVLDPSGAVELGGDGTLVDVTPDGDLLVANAIEPRDGAGTTRIVALVGSRVELWDRAADGLTVTALTPWAFGVLPDGDSIVSLTLPNPRLTEVTVASPGRSTTFPIEGALRPVEVTGNGRFVVLDDITAAELVVIDLREGETHRLPVGPGRVVAVDIR